MRDKSLNPNEIKIHQVNFCHLNINVLGYYVLVEDNKYPMEKLRYE